VIVESSSSGGTGRTERRQDGDRRLPSHLHPLSNDLTILTPDASGKERPIDIPPIRQYFVVSNGVALDVLHIAAQIRRSPLREPRRGRPHGPCVCDSGNITLIRADKVLVDVRNARGRADGCHHRHRTRLQPPSARRGFGPGFKVIGGWTLTMTPIRRR